MILNDREIAQLSETNDMISPFAAGVKRPGTISYGVTSFGYDMRVANEFAAFELDDVDPKNPPLSVRYEADVVVLHPGEFVLARSVEHFRMPEDVLGIVVGKSTYARCGLIVNCTPMEPGWFGHLTIELHNASTHRIKIYANEGIAQVVFHRGNRPAITYADKGGKYQGHTQVTAARVD